MTSIIKHDLVWKKGLTNRKKKAIVRLADGQSINLG